MFTTSEKEIMVQLLADKKQALRDRFNNEYFNIGAKEKRDIEIEIKEIGGMIEKLETA